MYIGPDRDLREGVAQDLQPGISPGRNDTFVVANSALLAGVGVALLVAGPTLIWRGVAGRQQVRTELSNQRIVFPSRDALPASLMPYAGAQVRAGDQARAFADFIANNLSKATEGRTYAQIVDELHAAPQADERLARLRETAFMGQSLRGALLTATTTPARRRKLSASATDRAPHRREHTCEARYPLRSRTRTTAQGARRSTSWEVGCSALESESNPRQTQTS